MVRIKAVEYSDTNKQINGIKQNYRNGFQYIYETLVDAKCGN